jgi:long-chain acyl-CoA synthetase
VYARAGAVWKTGGAAFGDDVRALAAALVGYGLSPGGCAVVLGSEGCDTLRAELAVLVAGGVLVSVDPALTDDALSLSFSSFQAVQAIASDETQLARILALRPDLPALDLVVLMAAVPSERKPAALLARTAMQFGAAALKNEPSMLRDALATEGTSHMLAVVRADGTVHSVDRRTLLSLAQGIAKTIGETAGRRVLSALPRGSVVRLAATLAVAAQGATLLLADPDESPDSGLGEHPADTVLLSMEALSRLQQRWQADLDGRPWIGRMIARWSLRQGADAGRDSWKYRLADLMTFRGLRARLGGGVSRLDVIRDDSAAGSAAGEFFEAIGLPVRYLQGTGKADSGPRIATS